ncbi:hypothetical protein Y1Q_0001352 [Alligator mississippiensis]|uniref:Uncharacterized protein n=1 Tax=Alligator mississippiensis TaxID=8496 RepID=A0A151M9C0_ALLMI|nr:hypothetical protein Y1Q_0001352 [Alligator mississippiensis]
MRWLSSSWYLGVKAFLKDGCEEAEEQEEELCNQQGSLFGCRGITNTFCALDKPSCPWEAGQSGDGFSIKP